MKRILLKIYLGIRWFILSPFLLFRETKTPVPGEIRRAVFFRNDRIGDMVVSTPFFRAFKKAFPGVHVTVVASEHNADVLKNSPYVDGIVLEKDLKDPKAQGFDLAVDLFYTYELKPAMAAAASGAHYRLGFEAGGREGFFNVRGPSLAGEGAMAGRLLKLLHALGIEASDTRPEIFLTEQEKAWAREYLATKKVDLNHTKVALHPGANFPAQRWPLERFIELARALRERLLVQVLVFCGKDEEARQAFASALADHVHIFSYLSLREFIALLDCCQLFVGNNSGPLHLAAALGLPTVSMTGPTDADLWEPSGDRSLVLRKNIPCLGCGRAVCSAHDCMQMITVDEVVAAVESQLKKSRHVAP